MQSKGTIYFLVNGIQTYPGSPKNWNKRGCTWIHKNTPFKAETDEYFTTALTVWIHQHARAETFAALLKSFAGWRIVIVAHSNGAWVAVNAMRIAHWVDVAELHLVSGACDANFARNGLNYSLKTGKLGRVVVYVAERDLAMRVEQTFAGHCLFGIYPGDKPLGLAGANNVDCEFEGDFSRFAVVREKYYGHSDWWLPINFNKTMQCFVASAC